MRKAKKLFVFVLSVVRSFLEDIIYLQVLGDRLVAATKSKVVSINPKTMAFYDADVKDVIVLENRIFIFTKMEE